MREDRRPFHKQHDIVLIDFALKTLLYWILHCFDLLSISRPWRTRPWKRPWRSRCPGEGRDPTFSRTSSGSLDPDSSPGKRFHFLPSSRPPGLLTRRVCIALALATDGWRSAPRRENAERRKA